MRNDRLINLTMQRVHEIANEIEVRIDPDHHQADDRLMAADVRIRLNEIRNWVAAVQDTIE